VKVVVTVEHRFDATPDGAVWTQTMFAHGFWRRYLEEFDEVKVVARVRPVSSPTPGWKRADGERVSFAAVPCYVGPWQYLRQSRRVKAAVRSAVGRTDAVIFRAPSHLANLMVPALRRDAHPFGVEVVGDPHDVFAPGAVKHPLRPLFRWWFRSRLKDLCSRACAAAYVTRDSLQRRYPPAPGAFAVGCSDVELPEGFLVASPRSSLRDPAAVALVHVGTLAQLYKAPDVLLGAVARCVRAGLDLRLVMVGDGKYRPSLEDLAHRLGLKGRVRFAGQITQGEGVRSELDAADLFVLPSHQEGLPRAMVEAMARGLPCIGSTVGGIPELLDAEDLVPPGDESALARKIEEVVREPGRVARMSARNLERARDYREEVLAGKRAEFFRAVRSQTEEWLRNGRHLNRPAADRSEACPAV
jgi:glycosyltransferase involved in cell wall biosynthesis